MSDMADLVGRASANARIFKPISILCVVFGHFYTWSGNRIPLLDYWWNISAMALVYFTMCSAYFTHIKYEKNFSRKDFWWNKVLRLGRKLVVVNLFLLLVFVAQDREQIISLYSLVNIVGLTGFLNWFGVRNVSPFGAGLWFLTLLFLFYAVYPWLRRLYVGRYYALTTLVALASLLVLDQYVRLGHTLWLTAAGYFLGMYASCMRVEWKSVSTFCAMIVLLFIFMILNIFGIKIANGFFILSITTCFFILTMLFPFHDTLIRKIMFIDRSVLEIFMIHTYLFYYATKNFLVDFGISLALILCVAMMLEYVSRIRISVSGLRFPSSRKCR
ncbi:MAG: hypothetical protein GX640_11175 [Fibrobacter sp.]|nr:hypothetical protein [Fibrobacter sp.]